MTATGKIRVLLVDDHAVVREGYRRLLEREHNLRIVGDASNGEQALLLLSRFSPDIVILDVTLGTESGLDVLGALLAACPTVRVIMFSMHAEAIFATRALQVGARAYVTKSSDPDELLQAVREVSAGNQYLSREIAQKLALASVRATKAPDDEPLTERERLLLRLLVDGRSVKDIAHLLAVSRKTVANAQSTLRRKLGASTPLQLVDRARTLGMLR